MNHDAHLHAEEGEDSQTPQKQHVDHLHEKEGKFQVLLYPKHNDGHLHAK